eukprot:CAMPEP_0184482270 /NCGR_PEP_ID=MMETSP0113_2-20130426/3831_1 /TAXON_ID=91329 /ORGANISM="Norrisiella sphaerica, Strain BC52" /LENGTH=723 /DNA_ID=CAMNT_0026861895 /DNA_START=413 /DNA_END=2584 /DNA_ORIENTATION=+
MYTFARVQRKEGGLEVFLMLLGMACLAILTNHPRGALGEKIDQKPRNPHRKVKHPFRTPLTDRQSPWKHTPKLGEEYERGFMDPRVWKEVWKMQENITVSPTKLLRQAKRQISGVPGHKVPNIDHLTEDMLSSADAVAYGVDMVTHATAAALFSIVHPFVSLPRKLTEYECLEIIQRVKHASCGLPALSVIQYMRQHDIPRSHEHFEPIFEPAAYAGRTDLIDQVEEWMSEDHIALTYNDKCYKVLVNGMASKPEKAKEEFSLLKSENCQLTVEAYNGLLATCISNPDLDKAESLLTEMISFGLKDNALTRHLLLKIYAGAGDFSRIESMKLAAPLDLDGNPTHFYHMLMLAHFNVGRPEDVYNAWKQSIECREPGLSDSTALHNLAMEYLGELANAHPGKELTLSQYVVDVWTHMKVIPHKKGRVDPGLAGAPAWQAEEDLPAKNGKHNHHHPTNASLCAVRNKDSYTIAAEVFRNLNAPQLALEVLGELKERGYTASPRIHLLATQEYEDQVQKVKDDLFLPDGVPEPPKDKPGTSKAHGRRLLRDFIFYCKDTSLRHLVASEIFAVLEADGWEPFESLNLDESLKTVQNEFDKLAQNGLLKETTLNQCYKMLAALHKRDELMAAEVEKFQQTWEEIANTVEASTGQAMNLPPLTLPEEIKLPRISRDEPMQRALEDAEVGIPLRSELLKDSNRKKENKKRNRMKRAVRRKGKSASRVTVM